mgnify:CR=1 FL=1
MHFASLSHLLSPVLRKKYKTLTVLQSLDTESFPIYLSICLSCQSSIVFSVSSRLVTSRNHLNFDFVFLIFSKLFQEDRILINRLIHYPIIPSPFWPSIRNSERKIHISGYSAFGYLNINFSHTLNQNNANLQIHISAQRPQLSPHQLVFKMPSLRSICVGLLLTPLLQLSSAAPVAPAVDCTKPGQTPALPLTGSKYQSISHHFSLHAPQVAPHFHLNSSRRPHCSLNQPQTQHPLPKNSHSKS